MALEGPRVLAQVMTGSTVTNTAAPPPSSCYDRYGYWFLEGRWWNYSSSSST